MEIKYTKTFYGTKIEKNNVLLGWINSSINNTFIFQNVITEENINGFKSFESAVEYSNNHYLNLFKNLDKIISASKS